MTEKENYLERLPFFITKTRFLRPTEHYGETCLMSLPECYSLGTIKSLDPPIEKPEDVLTQFIIPVEEPDKYNEDLHLEMFYLLEILERQTVITLLEEDTEKTKGLTFFQRISSAYKRITRENIRYKIINYKVTESIQKRLFSLRSSISSISCHSLVFQLICEGKTYEEIIKYFGRYLFIGHVTCDANDLRKYLWNLHYFKSEETGISSLF